MFKTGFRDQFHSDPRKWFKVDKGDIKFLRFGTKVVGVNSEPSHHNENEPWIAKGRIENQKVNCHTAGHGHNVCFEYAADVQAAPSSFGPEKPRKMTSIRWRQGPLPLDVDYFIPESEFRTLPNKDLNTFFYLNLSSYIENKLTNYKMAEEPGKKADLENARAGDVIVHPYGDGNFEARKVYGRISTPNHSRLIVSSASKWILGVEEAALEVLEEEGFRPKNIYSEERIEDYYVYSRNHSFINNINIMGCNSSEDTRSFWRKVSDYVKKKIDSSIKKQIQAGLRDDKVELTEEGKDLVLQYAAEIEEIEEKLTEKAKERLEDSDE